MGHGTSGQRRIFGHERNPFDGCIHQVRQNLVGIMSIPNEASDHFRQVHRRNTAVIDHLRHDLMPRLTKQECQQCGSVENIHSRDASRRRSEIRSSATLPGKRPPYSPRTHS